MAVYTVHQPPPREGETSPNPDRFVLVRDGFHAWAFLLGPLWMLWRRLWLVLVLFLVALAALEAGLRYAGAGGGGRMLVMLAVALLLGLEAGTLQRWTLRRRGFRDIGVVVGDDVEAAERRFFSGWMDDGQPSSHRPLPSPAAPAQTPPRRPAGGGQGGSNDVIGLFPDSGPAR
jgi:hypothetical protein